MSVIASVTSVFGRFDSDGPRRRIKLKKSTLRKLAKAIRPLFHPPSPPPPPPPPPPPVPPSASACVRASSTSRTPDLLLSRQNKTKQKQKKNHYYLLDYHFFSGVHHQIWCLVGNSTCRTHLGVAIVSGSIIIIIINIILSLLLLNYCCSDPLQLDTSISWDLLRLTVMVFGCANRIWCSHLDRCSLRYQVDWLIVKSLISAVFFSLIATRSSGMEFNGREERGEGRGGGFTTLPIEASALLSETAAALRLISAGYVYLSRTSGWPPIRVKPAAISTAIGPFHPQRNRCPFSSPYRQLRAIHPAASMRSN